MFAERSPTFAFRRDEAAEQEKSLRGGVFKMMEPIAKMLARDFSQ
jgi:hypothetical protein